MNAVEISIHAAACRGCELCVDVCPTRVFRFDADRRLCIVEHPEDCIACLSCAYVCPSHAISHTGYHLVKNFYRDHDFCMRVGKFL